MQRPIVSSIVLLLAMSVSGYCNATTIQYSVANIAGNTWQYNYSITNDTLSVDIDEFTVFFDVALYENLSLPTAPAGWDPVVFQPDSNLPDDGIYDVLALASGIAPNISLSGFSVQFDFLGIGTPGAQAFEIVDSGTFATLESGTTSLVPIPPSLALMLSGVLVLFGVVQRERIGLKLLPKHQPDF